jgi:hypothetical protein
MSRVSTTVIPASAASPGVGIQGKSLRARGLVFAAGVALLLALPFLDASAQSKREKPPEETPEQYPAGTYRDDTFYFCTACHGFKIVAQQGMSRERWNETFDIMVSRHKMVDVQGEQREQMLDYLTAAFPERRAPGGWKNPFDKR